MSPDLSVLHFLRGVPDRIHELFPVNRTAAESIHFIHAASAASADSADSDPAAVYGIKRNSVFRSDCDSTSALIVALFIIPEMKKLNRKIKEEDIVHFLVLMDESHLTINANKTAGIDEVIRMVREFRKYFGGLGLASQSIRDFIPDRADADAVDKIRYCLN